MRNLVKNSIIGGIAGLCVGRVLDIAAPQLSFWSHTAAVSLLLIAMIMIAAAYGSE